MKKSNFIALFLSVIGVLLFGLGMCMCLLPEWEMSQQGMVVSCVGFLILVIMVIVYRRMENKAPIRITAKTLFTILLGLIGVLALGGGMSLTMVFQEYLLGIGIGVVGILLLLCLIPAIKGIK